MWVTKPVLHVANALVVFKMALRNESQDGADEFIFLQMAECCPIKMIQNQFARDAQWGAAILYKIR